jgi:hypothetical protein
MLILSTFTELQTALLGLFASFAAPAGEEPLALSAAPEVTASELEGVYIERVDAFGTGCDEESVRAVIAPDKKSFTLTYRDMTLDRQNEDDPELQSKNCLATVTLHIPAGLKAAVSTVNLRGNAILDEDIVLKLRSMYFFAGDPSSTGAEHRIVGPYDDRFSFPDEHPFGPFSECGEQSVLYGIDSSMHLDASDNDEGAALINLSVTDVGLEATCYLEYQNC